MYYVVLVLLILDALLLAVVVLLQAGQGGGLASLGGAGGTSADTVVGGRQAVTLLHTLSWWCGGIFLVLSLILSIMSANRTQGASEVQERLRTTAPPAPQNAPLPLAPSPTPGAPGANEPAAGTGTTQPSAPAERSAGKPADSAGRK